MDLTQIGSLLGLNVTAVAESTAAVIFIIAALKKTIPAMQGKITMVVSGVMAMVFSIMTNITMGTHGIPIMIISSLLIFAGTTGAWELVKKVGGTANQ